MTSTSIYDVNDICIYINSNTFFYYHIFLPQNIGDILLAFLMHNSHTNTRRHPAHCSIIDVCCPLCVHTIEAPSTHACTHATQRQYLFDNKILESDIAVVCGAGARGRAPRNWSTSRARNLLRKLGTRDTHAHTNTVAINSSRPIKCASS